MTGCKGKNQVNFFMVSFKSILFSKISHMHWIFWAIYQIKKAYGISFYSRFSAYLFYKKFSNTLLNGQVLIFEKSGLASQNITI